MEVHLKPETASRLQQLSAETGRPAEDLLEDAMAGYLQELSATREMIDARYDELKNDGVETIDGEQALEAIRRKSRSRRSNPA